VYNDLLGVIESDDFSRETEVALILLGRLNLRECKSKLKGVILDKKNSTELRKLSVGSLFQGDNRHYHAVAIRNPKFSPIYPQRISAVTESAIVDLLPEIESDELYCHIIRLLLGCPRVEGKRKSLQYAIKLVKEEQNKVRVLSLMEGIGRFPDAEFGDILSTSIQKYCDPGDWRILLAALKATRKQSKDDATCEKLFDLAENHFRKDIRIAAICAIPVNSEEGVEYGKRLIDLYTRTTELREKQAVEMLFFLSRTTGVVLLSELLEAKGISDDDKKRITDYALRLKEIVRRTEEKAEKLKRLREYRGNSADTKEEPEQKPEDDREKEKD
jgi:hypothetical protein